MGGFKREKRTKKVFGEREATVRFAKKKKLKKGKVTGVTCATDALSNELTKRRNGVSFRKGWGRGSIKGLAPMAGDSPGGMPDIVDFP